MELESTIQQLRIVITDAFFPNLPGQVREQYVSLLKKGFGDSGTRSVAMKLSMVAGNRQSEKKLKLFFGFHHAFCGSLKYAVQGYDAAILDAFPAQRLVNHRSDITELVDWPNFWIEQGGSSGEMAALKSDPVWWRISFLNIPVAPFQIISGFDVEDMDRNEAESAGLIQPRQKIPPITITIDILDFETRLKNALAGIDLE